MKTDYTSYLLPDKEKAKGIYSFTPADLFDRIINLKLTTQDYKDKKGIVKHDEYVIRSDWEIYYPELGKIATGEVSDTALLTERYVRRCVYKPSIKVQYKQIASGTAIEIDIFISNFIMLSSDGRSLMSFSNLTYPLGQVEIQMGYFGQFNNKPKNFKEFFDFTNKRNVDTITVNVGSGYVQTDKLPPDGVLHIHGYVGSCYNASISDLQGVEVKSDWKTLNAPILKYDTYLQNYLFTNITRRFTRKAVNPVEVTIDKDSGLMGAPEAEEYGVKVFLSDKLAEIDKELTKKYSAKDKNGNLIENKKVKGIYSGTVVQAMNLVRDDVGIDISFKALTDGNFIAYLAEEAYDTEALAKALKKYKDKDTNLLEAGNVGSEVYQNILPAVENITTDALCTIVCPFFYFLNPFDLIRFKSRYALGGVVSYYADFNVKESKFYALYMTVSFATVDDINECTIVCTGSAEN